MATKPLMFPNVTAEEFQKLALEIEKEAGFTFIASAPDQEGASVSHEGTAESHHVKIGWVYNEEKQTLAITIVSKPFFMPDDVISRMLWEKVSTALATVRE